MQNVTSKIIYKPIIVKDTRKIFYKTDIQCIFYSDDVNDINTITMSLKITPVQILFFTKLSVALAFAWPPSPNATKFTVTSFKVLWFMSCLSSILLLIPLINSIYGDRDDPEILANSVALTCAVSQLTFKMMACRFHYNNFQVCI